jgi:beta-glucosidase
MKTVKLPSSLLLGVATAATQIEGGDYQNNWYEWGEKGNIEGGASSITACDHWNRVKEDTSLMKDLSIETYRMSIEWSRIEPFEGKWSDDGINHYIEEIDLLLANNILPLITLHHFSSPIWIQSMGGWSNKKVIDYFVRFVEKVTMFLGNRVSEYAIINEPNVFLNDTYMDGKYPGGEKGKVFKYFRAAKNMIEAHIRCYESIHALRKEQNFSGKTMVGVVHHLAYFQLNTKRRFFKVTKKFIDHSFHGLFLKGMIEGTLGFPFFGKKLRKSGTYADFIGINYYTRSMISPSWNLAMMFGKVHYKKNLDHKHKTDLDWEIYPKGIYSVIKDVYETYKLPIYVTENGIADREDNHRSRFISEHLFQVKKLIDIGVDVQRYYYWSLMDNLEWNEGYGPRFGLIHIDYKTMKRTVRSSGIDYRNIIQSRTISIEEE